MADSSPMMEQYRRIKNEHKDNVLFFRLGDFYEMFAEDAIEVSGILNLTLTSRNGVPMCGIPYHAARSYIARLLKTGKKIAVCEQVSEPGKGKGIVERKVVEVITPGTTVDEDYLDKGSSNYLACLALAGEQLSFSHIELSTGDFRCCAFNMDHAQERLRRELERLDARELIVQESLLEEYSSIAAALAERSSLVINRWADWLFDLERSRERLEEQFGTTNLKGFGLQERSPEIVSAGVLLEYLDETARSMLPHIKNLRIYGDDDYVGMDEASQRNLELIRNLYDGSDHYSLLDLMDETRTAMGRRLLKWRILHPLRQLSAIQSRLSEVSCLYHDQTNLSLFREVLTRAPDLERLSSRIAMDKAHGKDMVAVRNALSAFKKIHASALDAGLCMPSLQTPDKKAVKSLEDLEKLLSESICEDPSILLTEGNLIRQGYNKELDALHALKKDGRHLLEAYLEEERKATGIQNLKIKYNRLIGYFFEVTKTNLHLVPDHFIRRQGVVSGERFTSDKLIQLETDIHSASEKLIELEKKLFLEIRDKAKSCLVELLSAARYIARLDVAQSLAKTATLHAWVCPELREEPRLEILEGRHPVVEAQLARGSFVPNDVFLDADAVSFALISGPNMAGKSTYLRQTALICLLAQIGSFVPAREARLGIVDRIFCRVGASDNLARGESTFLVEMNETANILHSASRQSLVIMDEVGRGTGTKDGLSIAWAVCQELLDSIGCRTLFATHYHELSRIDHPKMVNRCMEVLEEDGTIVFLRKIREGASAESYGIHVARLAGIPEQVIVHAEKIMHTLNNYEHRIQDDLTESGESSSAAEAVDQTEAGSKSVQNSVINSILDDLNKLDIERMTPLEALNRIYAWKSIMDTRHVTPRSKESVHRQETPDLFD